MSCGIWQYYQYVKIATACRMRQDLTSRAGETQPCAIQFRRLASWLLRMGEQLPLSRGTVRERRDGEKDSAYGFSVPYPPLCVSINVGAREKSILSSNYRKAFANNKTSGNMHKSKKVLDKIQTHTVMSKLKTLFSFNTLN